MSSAFKDRRNRRHCGVFRSFLYACAGINSALKNETNMKIHFFISFFVIGAGFFFSLSPVEWLFVLFAIGGMLSLELINTAIERAVDLVTKEEHPLAKEAKDIAAGAVLIYAVLSVAVGLIIFIPKLL
ncbi:diacylglycerol kinase [Bacillus canaveralius]|uniref:Diacylglycerol kinase n=1 Tax=Bacillus canaveralius TaxID=1403243 RepID=A0A2N5GR34_9BACI|nr:MULTISPECIES: diacylglycerol kinase family protein [Bacillus]PLR85905.1 diacylglycerol kinase [Bacillus canaveralius]PLR87633.1 diacylglycerol kinase [Bacillus sp. V33-4]PLS00024.1 diacylglycerol kinase [Bacillus canaveralius]RSK56240.1 diacylglycerol kinase family protein [Bacillus canaveralius]